MDSWKFRRLTFLVFFAVFIPLCAILHYPLIGGTLAEIMHLVGLIVIIGTAAFAYYVHSLFPRRHDRPEDFEQLLKDGPYKYVRHPFYLAFIIMGFGVALFFVSIPGILLNVLMLLLWNKLAEMEEKELLEYWGEEYKEFMKTRGRFFPHLSGCSRRLFAVILLYSFGYFVHYALRTLFIDSYTKAFFLRLMVVVPVGFGFALIIRHVFDLDASFGLCRNNFIKSFLFASALSFPSPLLQLYQIEHHGLPPLNPQTSISLVFFSYLIFALYAFVLFQAFPLEILRPCGRMWLLVMPLFLFIYDSYFFNAGTFPPLGDLVLFVIVYALIYFKTRNVLGIVLAYLLIAEWDPWWVFGLSFGVDALKIVTYVRIGISLLALGILLLKAVKKS